MSGTGRLLVWTQTNRWVWSAAGVVILWLILSVVTNRFSISSLSGILVSASFLTILGLGQMLVVTGGRGNIDLSIPSVLTLNAYMGLIIVRGADENLLTGIAVALGIGVAVGIFNAILVVTLRVPAIIATLATGYVLATATLFANREIPGFVVSPILRGIASGRWFGVPIVVILALACVAGTAVLLKHTAYGHWLSAVGQNRAAAQLAGVKVGRVVASTFVISALVSSLMGLLLGANVGGAFLEMGQPYLLQTIAAVVVGGTLIFGGSATAVGTFFASVLLILIVTTMQIMSLPPGLQDVVQGMVVIAVLGLAGWETSARRRSLIPNTTAAGSFHRDSGAT